MDLRSYRRRSVVEFCDCWVFNCSCVNRDIDSHPAPISINFEQSNNKSLSTETKIPVVVIHSRTILPGRHLLYWYLSRSCSTELITLNMILLILSNLAPLYHWQETTLIIAFFPHKACESSKMPQVEKTHCYAFSQLTNICGLFFGLEPFEHHRWKIM